MRKQKNSFNLMPRAQGLYNPKFEHDSCGVGFVVNINGKKSHKIVKDALTVLNNLDHRGARGAEPDTGDGAGILTQIPHKFFEKISQHENFSLPAEDEYAVGMLFLPQDKKEEARCLKILEQNILAYDMQILGIRKVKTSNHSIGKSAKNCEPNIKQIFIKKNKSIKSQIEFERQLYFIRKQTENSLSNNFYIASFSSQTIVYKGMLTPEQVSLYYPDLTDPDFQSALALVHSRFSTNTFPSWERAHPNRYIIHNGEINTIEGNVNWFKARQGQMQSKVLGNNLKNIFPILQENGSDSSIFDNCFEFLVLSGFSLAHTAMMMIPEPWEKDKQMSKEKKAFYEYHSALMEPWDGPASIAFTDGTSVGAILDRNGLRPSRYYVTKDDMVIMASEVGVLDIKPENILKKGRLEPGKILLIDTAIGKIISDEEIKSQIISEKPYQQWINENLLILAELPKVLTNGDSAPKIHNLIQQQITFGYTYEEENLLLAEMVKTGVDPLGSMGNDAPLAVLSHKSHLLYNYFRQLFAQVTNPPIDSLREEIITSAITYLGSEQNLLEPSEANIKRIKLENPFLTNLELEQIKKLNLTSFKTQTFNILFEAKKEGSGLKKALDELFKKVDSAIKKETNIIILSDQNTNENFAPIPALLAVSGLHHHLIKNKTRTKVSLILESAEPRLVHHVAVLLGYGADAINPYLALDILDKLINKGILSKTLTKSDAEHKYLKCLSKGVIKIISKMGISTIQSYRGAQIFEAVGISKKVIDEFFTHTTSRIKGIDLDIIAKETLIRHKKAFNSSQLELESGGEFKWRSGDEYHAINPQTVYKIQQACRTNNYALYKEFTKLVYNPADHLCALRDLFEFNYAKKPIPLNKVESVDNIVKRFKTGAMSYGSISKEAHETLAIAMNRLGGKSNTGEGGEDPERFTTLPNGDSKCSAIKQVASGRFGVNIRYLVNAKEIQIKMAQGAKPGEGGQLPGNKVYPWIAKTRHSTPGVGLISPPPHHDIYSIEDLAQLIHDLKNVNEKARISVKLVSEIGVGTIAAGVAKGHADVILISGSEGGTGASPRTSIKNAGLPWELGLAEANQTLRLNNLRNRVTLETDGQLKTGRDIAIAALLGAEEFGFATLPLIVLGCVMMRVCHLDTCPVGVATQNPELRKRFRGKPEYVENLMRFMAEDLREIMAKLGFKTINEMIGRSEKLKQNKNLKHWKASSLDLSAILYQPELMNKNNRFCQIAQNHGLKNSLDKQKLINLSKNALTNKTNVNFELKIKNTNRNIGTMLGSQIIQKYPDGLKNDTIKIKCLGSAGQSFGAFIPKGLTLELEGDANDYVGKGLSGGKIIIYPSQNSYFVSSENIIIGNVAFYGATSGEAYINGAAGERFCVRNSGISAVVENVGDHACEYMTGGKVVILGKTGKNFGAGMSGGIAYIYDKNKSFSKNLNREMVNLLYLSDQAEINHLKKLISNHFQYTKSLKAKKILTAWEESINHFVKVLPEDYQRMLKLIKEKHEEGLSGDEALMAAFSANKNDELRVGGN